MCITWSTQHACHVIHTACASSDPHGKCTMWFHMACAPRDSTRHARRVTPHGLRATWFYPACASRDPRHVRLVIYNMCATWSMACAQRDPRHVRHVIHVICATWSTAYAPRDPQHARHVIHGISLHDLGQARHVIHMACAPCDSTRHVRHVTPHGMEATWLHMPCVPLDSAALCAPEAAGVVL